MSGNVREWCWDWYDTVSPETLPTGPDSGLFRVFRGGSLSNAAFNCALSYRYYDGPYNGGHNLGFRVVCGN
jgi:formylglycine-generating enzyme required for sulfatase activity